MRITIDLEDDLYHLVAERAQADGCSLATVLSVLARQALAVDNPSGRAFFGFEPFTRASGRVTNQEINLIRDDLGI
jgi:hypothetical protein